MSSNATGKEGPGSLPKPLLRLKKDVPPNVYGGLSRPPGAPFCLNAAIPNHKMYNVPCYMFYGPWAQNKRGHNKVGNHGNRRIQDCPWLLSHGKTHPVRPSSATKLPLTKLRRMPSSGSSKPGVLKTKSECKHLTSVNSEGILDHPMSATHVSLH